jgi:YegS/Rv2252/BmrU family lipid kinase
MPNSEYHVIVNPVSSGGEAGRRWPETESKIRNALKDFSFELTHAGGDGERLAASAVHAGVKTLIVVGGDGTLSEVANGILQFAPEQRPSLAVLNYGTGGDFVRTTGAPADLSLMLEKIKMRREINIDAGRISFTNHQGLSARRHFINIAGCGLAGSVVNAVNQASKRFGAFTYFASSLSSAVTYKNPRVRISIDDGPFTTETITTLAVCNGQFFGGGMQIAPDASITDGLLNITILGDWSLAQKVKYSRNLYNGTITHCYGVKSFQARTIRVEPDIMRPILIDCDGECPGQLPMTAEVLPGAIRLIV